MDAIVTKLRLFQCKRKFEEGHKYYVGLSNDNYQDEDVAVAAACMYIAQGHQQRAELALEALQSKYKSFTPIVDEIHGLFALLTCKIKIYRYCKYEEAGNLLASITNDYIQRGFSELLIAMLDKKPSFSTIWSDRRVLIEILSYSVTMDACMNGLMSTKTQLEAQKRQILFLQHLITQKRWIMATLSLEDAVVSEDCVHLLDEFLQLPRLDNGTILFYGGRGQLPMSNDETVFCVSARDTLRYRLRASNAPLKPSRQELLLDWAKVNNNLFLLKAGIWFWVCSLADIVKTVAEQSDKTGPWAFNREQAHDLMLNHAMSIAVQFLWPTIPFEVLDEEIRLVEDRLDKGQNRFLFCDTRLRRLICYSREHLYVDQALEYLSAIVNTGVVQKTEMPPRQIYLLNKGIFDCLRALADQVKAVDLAMALCVTSICKEQKNFLSDGFLDYCDAVTDHAILTLEKAAENNDFTTRDEWKNNLFSCARGLEQWAIYDQNLGRWSQYQRKTQSLCRLYRTVKDFYPDVDVLYEIDKWTKALLDNLGLHLYVEQGMELQLMNLADHGEYLAAYERGQEVIQEILPRSRFHLYYPEEARARTIYGQSLSNMCHCRQDNENCQQFLDRLFSTLTEDFERLKQPSAKQGTQILMRTQVLCQWIPHLSTLHPEKKLEYLKVAHSFLAEAREHMEDRRRALFDSDDVSSILRKRKFVSQEGYSRGVVRSATYMFLKLDMVGLAWEWIQNGRARAYLDMLDSRAEKIRIRVSHEAGEGNNGKSFTEFPDYDHDILEYLTNIDTSLALFEQRRSGIRKTLQNYRFDLFKFDNSKFGQTFDLKTLRAAASSMQPWLQLGVQVIFMDWFINEDGIFWLVFDATASNAAPISKKLAITQAEIRKWKTKYIGFSTASDHPLFHWPRALSDLGALLEGINEVIAERALVVLSQPFQLTGIPLQAIPINGKPFFERNQIIFSTSAAIYQREIVALSKLSNLASRNTNRGIFVAIYEDSGSGEQKRIYESTAKIAHSMSARPLCGSVVDVKSFEQCLKVYSWIHYHGHVDFFSGEAEKQNFVLVEDFREAREMEQELRLLEQTEKNKDRRTLNEILMGSPEARKLRTRLDARKRVERYAVSEILGLDLYDTAPFVCIVGCESGLQEVTMGDEPLGIVSALLAAGASTVLGTLWPIESSFGRYFSGLFYKNVCETIEKNRQKQGLKVLDLSLELQKAIKCAKSEAPDRLWKRPYYWASFVLHGVGFYLYE